MKYAILAILLISLFNANAATIEEQIKECESSPYPDLCLAALSRSDDLALYSDKPQEELIADCRNSAYEDLCIAALAKAKNDRQICALIEDELLMESCLKGFETAPASNAAESGNNEPFNFISFSVMMAIIIILYILYRRKKKNT